MKIRSFIVFLLLFAGLFCGTLKPILAEIVTQNVEYKQSDETLEGFLAYDESLSEKRPAVVVVHEWKGLNDYAKSRARQLAEMGYVALAADIYGKGKRAENHEEAAKLAGIYRNDRKLMRARAKAAYDLLVHHPLVDSDKIAAIGYCFGGTTVLEMARAGFDLKGAASFHGSLATPMPAEKGTVKAKVIVFHGGDDKFESEKEVKEFYEEMNKAGADWQFVIFGGAVHSFTVPAAGNDKSQGIAYDEKADKRSWTMLQNFLKEVFA